MRYQSKVTGEYLQLLIKRESNVNTYLQVDKSGNPIIKRRSFSNKPQEVKKIIKGFDQLIICNERQD